jgi:hypothetical protein
MCGELPLANNPGRPGNPYSPPLPLCFLCQARIGLRNFSILSYSILFKRYLYIQITIHHGIMSI